MSMTDLNKPAKRVPNWFNHHYKEVLDDHADRLDRMWLMIKDRYTTIVSRDLTKTLDIHNETINILQHQMSLALKEIEELRVELSLREVSKLVETRTDIRDVPPGPFYSGMIINNFLSTLTRTDPWFFEDESRSPEHQFYRVVRRSDKYSHSFYNKVEAIAVCAALNWAARGGE